jgi:hypothetical protein
MGYSGVSLNLQAQYYKQKIHSQYSKPIRCKLNEFK